ncbi:MAG: amidohydrolase [Candidatus Bathyarchaeota archaeon]|nr:MAG: amidohydrolase [Candidatus Bathyarchaeota archaeon]
MVVVDFHVHAQKLDAILIGKSEFVHEKVILKSMDEAGVDYSVLILMALKGELDETRKMNDRLAVVCEGENRLVGFGSVHPLDGEFVLEEMERCVRDLRLKGFKFHPFVQDFDVGEPIVTDIFKKAAELDVPVLIDSCDARDATQNTKFLNIALACPDTKICFAHVGLHRFMDYFIFGFLKGTPLFKTDVYFDLTSSCSIFRNSPFQEQFLWITKLLGPDRLLFGSDFPGNGQRNSIEDIVGFGYPVDWRPKILGENAAKLLKL